MSIKLLVIEDDSDYLDLLNSTLASVALEDTTSPGFEVITVDTLGGGIDHLAGNSIEAVLLDLFLPDSQGLDTFRQLQAQAPGVPIIVMSSLDDEATAIDSVKEGAQDYLVKGRVPGDLLVRSIRYAIERKQAEKALLAAHDKLEQRVQERTAELAKVNAELEEDIAERRRAEKALKDSNTLLSAISQVLALYISDIPPEKVFEELLQVLVSVTQSEYGFIGEVRQTTEGSPYLLSRTITNIARNDEIRKFYEENLTEGLKFTKLDSLYGNVLTTEKVVFSNDPANDPRSHGLPPGHPALNSFLGIPFHEGDTLVGMAGVANRKGGYDETLLEFLKPLTTATASLIVGWRTSQRREEVEQALRDSEVKYRTLTQSGRDAIVSANVYGIITSWNQGAATMFGYSEEEILGLPVTVLMPEQYRAMNDSEFFEGLKSGVLQPGQQAVEGLGLRKDGFEFPAELSLSIWNVGTDYFATAIIRDVTDRKRIEREVLEISEREQRRIGQDLHDDLGQKLTGIAFLSQALAQKLEKHGGAGESAKDAGQIARLANEAIEGTRRLARDLYPVNLERSDLESALAELVAGVESYSEVVCQLECSMEAPMRDIKLATHLYRIAQEALNNAVRHSGAQNILVTLVIREDGTKLAVRDDGRGLPKDLTGKIGMGMQNMQYRASAIQGSLNIGTHEDGGTEVICSVQHT